MSDPPKLDNRPQRAALKCQAVMLDGKICGRETNYSFNGKPLCSMHEPRPKLLEKGYEQESRESPAAESTEGTAQ